MRTGAASNSGRVRFNMWAATNIDGTGGVRKLNSSTLIGTAVTMNSATTTFNSTVTWAAPQIILNNEYVFLQPEWQSTVVGTSNSCTAQFYQASFTTTDFKYNVSANGLTTGSPVLGTPALIENVPPAIGTGELTALPSVRTNKIPYSQDIGDATWTKGDLTHTLNTYVAPDSTTTADTITTTAALAYHRLYPNPSPSPAGTYTFSLYMKESAAAWAQLYSGFAGFCNFNLSAGTIGNNSGGGTITPVGDGWYRCSIPITTAGAAIQPQIYPLPNDASVAPEHGSVGYSIAVWGAQLEAGNAPTAYIPTTTSAVTISETIAGFGTAAWNATGALFWSGVHAT